MKDTMEELNIQKVKHNPYNIKDIENPTETVQLIAVTQSGYVIDHITNPSEDVQLAAVKKKWFVYSIHRNTFISCAISSS